MLGQGGVETKDPAYRPLDLTDTPIWPRDSPGGVAKTLVRDARSNPTGPLECPCHLEGISSQGFG